MKKAARRGLTRPTNETQETMSRLFSCIPGFLMPDKFKP
jgi:starvation-inducible outer membrane lipoprotein